MLPATHLFSRGDVRDLSSGEPSHLSPAWLPVVVRDSPRIATTVNASELDAALERWPSLTAHLPDEGLVIGPDKDRVQWRVLGEDAEGQLVELRRSGLAYTQTLRYRVRDDRVQMLQSRLLSLPHIAKGTAVGLAFAGLFWFVMRRVKQRRTARGAVSAA